MSVSLITPVTYLKCATQSFRLPTQALLSSNQTPVRHGSSAPSGKTCFTYRLAAAAAPKQGPRRQRQPEFNQQSWHYSSAQQLASPPYLRSSKPDSGEDAFFATTVGGSPHHVAFGVADGVGGWQNQGIDPSEFSHALCGAMAAAAYMHEGIEEGRVKEEPKLPRPQNLMQIAYNAVLSNPRIVAGGCTASLAVADKDGRMETANLGDSGFLIFSPGEISHRSVIQTHEFNAPFQLAKVPARMRAQHAIFGGTPQFSETPAHSDVENHQLKHGDLVLFATDGVWDNLSAQDTLRIVMKVMEEQGYWFKSHNFPDATTMLNETMIRMMPKTLVDGEKETEKYLPGLVATAVMREAKVAGEDRRRDGPFAKELKKQYPLEGWQGGKPDDIAVVVAVAVEDDADMSSDEKPIKAKL